MQSSLSSSNGAPFPNGTVVCNFYRLDANAYVACSIGEVIDSRVNGDQIKYKIHWTSGPDSGKISWKLHVFLFAPRLEERRQIVKRWIKEFEQFCINRGFQPKLLGE